MPRMLQCVHRCMASEHGHLMLTLLHGVYLCRSQSAASSRPGQSDAVRWETKCWDAPAAAGQALQLPQPHRGRSFCAGAQRNSVTLTYEVLCESLTRERRSDGMPVADV
jgi:hypothetical protein